MIIGVHGIAQQQRGRRQLVQEWGPALTDGVELAAGNHVREVPFDLAFYGHLFLKQRPPGSLRAAEEDSLEDLSDEEVNALLEAAGEAVSADQIRAAEAAPAMGYTRLPRPLQAVARAMDATFGASAGVLYLGTLRQVRRYLRDPPLKTRVDGVVASAVPANCRILIGHSLGSVVALEFVRQHPDHPLDLLLTAGSPLGLHMVQAALPVSSYGSKHPAGIPRNVTRWVDLRDPHDPVACAGKLSTWWSGVQDEPVDNGGDAHKIHRYLSKQQAGAAILAAAPELAEGPAS